MQISLAFILLLMGMAEHHRLLMNLELLKVGYPPSVITVENRLAYYEALDQWMAYGKTELFINMIADIALDGFRAVTRLNPE